LFLNFGLNYCNYADFLKERHLTGKDVNYGLISSDEIKKQFCFNLIEGTEFNEEEKKLSEANLKKREENVDWLKYQLEYYDMMLNKGLELNYLQTIRKYKEIRKEYESELKVEEETIKVLKDQIENGVEVKTEVVDDENDNDISYNNNFKKFCD